MEEFRAVVIFFLGETLLGWGPDIGRVTGSTCSVQFSSCAVKFSELGV